MLSALRVRRWHGWRESIVHECGYLKVVHCHCLFACARQNRKVWYYSEYYERLRRYLQMHVQVHRLCALALMRALCHCCVWILEPSYFHLLLPCFVI